MNASEMLAMLDERLSDGRVYPTLDDYSAAFARIRQRQEQSRIDAELVRLMTNRSTTDHFGQRSALEALASQQQSETRAQYEQELLQRWPASLPKPATLTFWQQMGLGNHRGR